MADYFEYSTMLDNLNATQNVGNQIEALRREMQDMRANTVSMDKYNKLMEERNKLVRDYNCHTANFVAQRDEALEIFKENQDKLPFTPDEARARMRAKGFAAEEAELQSMDIQ